MDTKLKWGVIGAVIGFLWAAVTTIIYSYGEQGGFSFSLEIFIAIIFFGLGGALLGFVPGLIVGLIIEKVKNRK